MSYITTKNADDLAQKVMEHVASYRVNGQLTARFERIDRAVQREADRTAEAIKSAQSRARGKLDRPTDFEIPLGFVQYQSALAWLSSIFATGVPMFRAVSTKQLEEVASMMNALINSDQTRVRWTSTLSVSGLHVAL